MVVEVGIRWDDCAFVSQRRAVKFCSAEAYAALDFGVYAGWRVVPRAYGIQCLLGMRVDQEGSRRLYNYLILTRQLRLT